MTTYTININLQHCVHCGADHQSIISTAVGNDKNLFLAPIADHAPEVIHNITNSLLPFCPTCMPETSDTETTPLNFIENRPPSFSTISIINSRTRITRTYTLEDL
jgi:hypothetical protein